VYNTNSSNNFNCLNPRDPIFCGENFGNFTSGGAVISGLTVDKVYYIRLWTNGESLFHSFNFFLETPPAIPINDECRNAIEITPSGFDKYCNKVIEVLNANASFSSTVNNVCSYPPEKSDIWYKFIATSNNYTVKVENLQTLVGYENYDVIELYDGGVNPQNICQSGLAPITCLQLTKQSKTLARNLIPGNTYFLRISTPSTFTFNESWSKFELCIQALTPPPNDECVNATTLSLQNSAAQCVDPIQVETAGATLSIPTVSCMNGSQTRGDVWYKFTATATRVRFILSQLKASIDDFSALGLAIYTGNCPTGSTSVYCNAAFATSERSTLFSGLTLGATYYLRFWSQGTNNTAVSFTFCAQAVPVPSNDECANAIELIVGKGFGTHPIVATIQDATVSPGSVSAVCRPDSRVSDLWFSSNIPETGNLIVQTAPADSTVSDLVMEAYTGTCGSLAMIACNDNGNPEPITANHPQISLTGRTPGEKITFRVVAANVASLGRFNIYAFDTTTSQVPAILSQANCESLDTLIISSASGNGYRWLPVLNEDGHVIAEIFPNGNYLDSIMTKLFVNNSGTQRQKNGKYYADRNVSLTNTKGNFNGKVRLYIKREEIKTLGEADNSVLQADSLQILSDTTFCSNQLQTINFAYSSKAGKYGTDYFLGFVPTNLSQFFITATCQPTLTWTGMENSNWHNPNNWSCATIPGPDAVIFVPAGTPNNPVISSLVEIKGLQLQKDGSITIAPGIPLIITGQ
jgi:hypothetical protein